MPEPSGLATFAGQICQGVYRYTMHDDRIDFESDSYVLAVEGHVIFIDPLPVDERELAQHGPPEVICLSASCHERSAWRYRRRYRIPVYAPQGGVDFEEPPDRWYRAGEQLPGGLLAVHAPGPTEAHYAFYLDRAGGLVFCADLLTNAGGAGLAFVPDEYQDEPARTRDSVRRLLELGGEILCSDHGAPVLGGVRAALQQVLTRDQKRQA